MQTDHCHMHSCSHRLICLSVPPVYSSTSTDIPTLSPAEFILVTDFIYSTNNCNHFYVILIKNVNFSHSFSL